MVTSQGEDSVTLECPKCGTSRTLPRDAAPADGKPPHTCPRCSTIVVVRHAPISASDLPALELVPHVPKPQPSGTQIMELGEGDIVPEDGAFPESAEAVVRRAVMEEAAARHASDRSPSNATTQELPPGVGEALADPSKCLGHYALLGELGRGGMGVVYRAYDTVLRRQVAIKWMILDPTQAGDERVRRFRREASATARLRHPGIVTVYETGEHQGKPYIVMELIEGESLETALSRPGEPLSARHVVQLVRSVAQALDHAHQCGVVHRDVKPENVIVDRSGVPHLMDFGLARDATLAENMTVTGHVVGTPAYMAPEQARGKRDQGPQTDVYGLGAILYRALTGKPPFSAETVMLCLRKVLSEDPEPLRKVNPRIHPDLEAISLRCLAKEPGKRYGHASEVAEDLRRWLDGEPISAARPGRERAGRTVRRRSVWLTAAAAVIVLALGGTLGGVPLGVYTFRAIEAKAEKARRVAEARKDAASKWQRFRQAYATPAPQDEDDEARRLRLEPLVGLALQAADSTERVATLVPDDGPARQKAADMALLLGDVALDCEQWSLATQAYTRAHDLRGSDPRSSRSPFGRVEAAREKLREEHRRVVESVLAEVSSGSLSQGVGGQGRDDALFTLVAHGVREPQTVALIAAALDGVSQELRGATRESYLAGGRSDGGDGSSGALAGLEAAVDKWLELAPGATLDADASALLERSAKRLEERSARSGERTTFRALVASLQERTVGPERLELAAVCCQALGRIGVRKDAVRSLGAFLVSVEDERRAVPAGAALCLLGGEEAMRFLELGRGRFPESGAFREEVARVLERKAAARPESETPRAFLDRAILRRERGDLAGAIADATRALELDSECQDAWRDRALAREKTGDRAGAIADLERLLELAAPDSPHAKAARAKVAELKAGK